MQAKRTSLSEIAVSLLVLGVLAAFATPRLVISSQAPARQGGPDSSCAARPVRATDAVERANEVRVKYASDPVGAGGADIDQAGPGRATREDGQQWHGSGQN